MIATLLLLLLSAVCAAPDSSSWPQRRRALSATIFGSSSARAKLPTRRWSKPPPDAVVDGNPDDTRALKSDDGSESGTAAGVAPPSLDELWDSTASFRLLRSIPVGDPGLPDVDAGTRVLELNGTWFLFGRHDTGATKKCPSGEISINVRASSDAGAHWGAPHLIAKPDEIKYCIYADGSAFFDTASQTWHYLVQVLDVGGKGGWQGAHFSLQGPSPFGKWVADAANPVITSGSLWKQICAGGGKHCEVGMVDEGTFDIVEKAGADFIVTFHGYDYQRRKAARGVARTADFVTWEVTGGAAGLPGDAIFAATDCEHWNVSWAPGGCIGSGEASILRSKGGYMYQVIEAADVALTCDLNRGEQWWPLGLVRSKTWKASPGWEQMKQTPFVGGPDGGEPHVGCSIQYNSLHQDMSTGKTYFEYWAVSFNSANKSSPGQYWAMYELVWGKGKYPIVWPGPAQSPSPPPAPVPDCSTKSKCQATCKGFVACPTDTVYYCCTDAARTGCTGVHNCTGTPGLLDCACPAVKLKSDDATTVRAKMDDHDAILWKVDVMEAGATTTAGINYTAFRIPGVATLRDSVLVFAEGRRFTCNDYGNHDLILRRSTDNGQTFTALRTILQPNKHWGDCNQTELAGPVPNHIEGGVCRGGCAVWDPTPVVDNRTGTIYVFFGRSKSSCPWNGGTDWGGRRADVWLMKSTDIGRTWSEPRNMSSSCSNSTPPAPGSLPGSSYGPVDTPSGGHGVQLSTGDLLVPVYGIAPFGGQGLCKSSDGGDTWTTGGLTISETGANGKPATGVEGEIVELLGRTADGGPRLMFNTRIDGAASCAAKAPKQQCRLTYVSDSLGEDWLQQITFHTEMPDPGCKGGIVRFDARQYSGNRSAIFAIGATAADSCSGDVVDPACACDWNMTAVQPEGMCKQGVPVMASNGGVRTNDTLFISTDDGVSFQQKIQLDASGGYSTAAIASDGNLVALYETSGGVFCKRASHPLYQTCNPAQCNVRLAMVDPATLLDDVHAALKTDDASQRRPAPVSFRRLLVGDTDPRGIILRPANCTLTAPHAILDNHENVTMTFQHTYSDIGSYAWANSATRCHGACVGVTSTKQVWQMKPNRRYIVAAVIRTAFPRLTTEVNIGTYLIHNGHTHDTHKLVHTHMNGSRSGGLPSNSSEIDGNVDGFVRWEWEFVTPADREVQAGALSIHVYASWKVPLQLDIADFAVIETPPATPAPFDVGGGLTFRGGAGSLNMRVLKCSTTQVLTTAARYTFDLARDTIDAEQQIEMSRPVSRWSISRPLRGLEVVASSVSQCVLVTGDKSLSIGVQMDGLLGFVPHDVPLELTVASKFSGTFSRAADGHILTEDDWGGFTVSPWMQQGSGRVAALHNHSNDTFFLIPRNDVNTTIPAPAGWWASWSVVPGDRLFTSVMPVRPYNWEDSFTFHWSGCYSDVDKCAAMVGPNASLSYVNNLILWNAANKQWGMSYRGPFLPTPSQAAVADTVSALHKLGVRALPYMSAWFHSTRNATEYVAHVAAWKDQFGINGIYSDGLPEDDWIVAYEEMRMLRELFPKGSLIIHDTIREEAMPAAEYRPFLHAYADATLMGESMISNAGESWQWPRYCTSQFRKSNAFGAVKGNKWNGTGSMANLGPTKQPVTQDFVSLVYGGRDRGGNVGYSQYLSALAQLHKVWVQHYAGATSEDGLLSTFYDQYYLPAVHNITGVRVGRAPMPIASSASDGKISLSCHKDSSMHKIRYTLDGSAVTEHSQLYIGTITRPAGALLRAVTFAEDLDPSRELVVTDKDMARVLKSDDTLELEESTGGGLSYVTL